MGMSCCDIKGLVPKWVINMLAPKAPKEWVENLRKAALDYQQANPGYREALAGELDKYKEDDPFDYEDLDSMADDDVPRSPAAVQAAPKETLQSKDDEQSVPSKGRGGGVRPISL